MGEIEEQEEFKRGGWMGKWNKGLRRKIRILGVFGIIGVFGVFMVFRGFWGFYGF